MKTILSLTVVAAIISAGAVFAQGTGPGNMSSTAGACNTATGNALSAGNLGGPGTGKMNNCNPAQPTAVITPLPEPAAVITPQPAPVAEAPKPAPAPVIAAAPEPAPAPVLVARADRN